MRFLIPKDYKDPLTYIESENAIKLTKDTFERKLAKALNLTRVSAPLFVETTSGLNDDLNGVERSVQFDIKETQSTVEIVHSLSKWKRQALKEYSFDLFTGLYTDMNAIRRDEELSNIHSVYVDQWDWEKIITQESRTFDTLKEHVRLIVKALKETQEDVLVAYPHLQKILTKEVTFITSQELLDLYPDKDAQEREYLFAKEHQIICVMQIGNQLSDGTVHSGRAADYDDWQLNADIIVYYPILDMAVEISSMGIRVDAKSLMKQLEIRNQLHKLAFPFHKQLISGELPFTIGGGIGQSRICLLLLNKAHIGEVQVSLWDEQTKQMAKEHGIHLL